LNFTDTPISKTPTAFTTAILGCHMRKLLAGSLVAAALTFSVAGAPTWAADASIDQVYQSMRSGHLQDAQQMMDQVLRDHAGSWKAHFVQAELSAREGDYSRARNELARAEQIAPGLPNENPQSVQELRTEIAGARHEGRPFVAGSESSSAHFPWGAVVIGLLVILFLWMIFRRRTYVQYPAGPAPMGPGPAYGPGYGGPGGYVGPGGGVVGGGGIGSNIAGGLAGRLAAGAGIVAGEEIAHHFLDGNERHAVPPPADDWGSNPANSDMGGNDFGINDPGSWDDGSGGGGGDSGGGGGDDWT
jgi:uncharacterized protein